MGLTYNEVISTANSLGEDPAGVFAYTAHYNQLPVGRPDVDALVAQLGTILAGFTTKPATGGAASAPFDLSLLEGYVAETGIFPSSAQQVTSWGQNSGYVDGSGVQQSSPKAGDHYKYGVPANVAASVPTATTAPNVLGFNLPSLDLSTLSKNPVALGAGALGLFLLLGRRRR